MRDKHSDLMRVGKVSSIDYEKCTAQVVFEDRHDLVSGDLHILVPLTLKDHSYYMPDIDERVLCIFDPSAPTKGFIAASFYADTRLPPIQNKDKRYIKFKDETLLEYDRDIHKLTVKIPATAQGDISIEVETESDITVKTNGNICVEALKDIDVKSHQNIFEKALEDITVEAQQNISITAKENITIEATKNIDVLAVENIDIYAAKAINISAVEPITIQSDTIIVLQGPTTTLTVP